MRGLIAGLVALGAACGPVAAGGVDVSGFVAAELRTFLDAPQFPGQLDGAQASGIISPEFDYEPNSGIDRFSLTPFVRVDSRDSERTHFDLREAYWLHMTESWELLVGLDKVFWGVTESRHLVDIINQTDFVEDIDNEDKLGQPMINLGTLRDWGSLSLYLLPGFRERTFPGRKGRLRPGIPIDEDAAEYESDLEEWHVDVALRYAHFFGAWDVGVYYFYGTGREPRLLPNTAGTRLIPRYDLIHQVGADVQYTADAWLWKLETIVREGQGKLFAAATGGFEYTRYQILETSADLGLLFEYHYDGRDEVEAPFTSFDDDLFFGGRLALNDVDDTSALAGAIVDRVTHSSALFIEAERRIGDAWKIELEGRLFRNVDRQDPMRAFKDDDFVLMRLSRFF